MPVVTVKPLRELVGAMSGSIKGGSIGPLAQGRLDEALSLAIGLGGVGTGANVFDAQPTAGASKGQGVEAGAIVGHDALQAHTEALIVSDRLLEESDGTGLLLVGMDGGMS